jgi:hypothetical protein
MVTRVLVQRRQADPQEPARQTSRNYAGDSNVTLHVSGRAWCWGVPQHDTSPHLSPKLTRRSTRRDGLNRKPRDASMSCQAAGAMTLGLGVLS